jgi:hypothetical protein
MKISLLHAHDAMNVRDWKLHGGRANTFEYFMMYITEVEEEFKLKFIRIFFYRIALIHDKKLLKAFGMEKHFLLRIFCYLLNIGLI